MITSDFFVSKNVNISKYLLNLYSLFSLYLFQYNRVTDYATETREMQEMITSDKVKYRRLN